MITLQSLLVADRAIRDSETGNLSIINILEDITAEAFPILIPRLTVVAFINKETNDDSTQILHLKICNNENIISNNQIKVDFREKNKSKVIIQLGTLPINELGKVHFILENINRVELERYSIGLKLREEITVTSE